MRKPQKKSQHIVLTSIMLAAISSCGPSDNWTYGTDAGGHARDTAVYRNGGYHYYRYYGGGWYALQRNNMINTGAYAPAASSEISRPSFTPRAASGSIESGGFGESAHGSGAGE